MMSRLLSKLREKRATTDELKKGFEFLRKVHMGNSAALDAMISECGLSLSEPSDAADVAEMKLQIINLADFIFDNEAINNYVKKYVITKCAPKEDEYIEFQKDLGRLLLSANEIDINDRSTRKELQQAMIRKNLKLYIIPETITKTFSAVDYIGHALFSVADFL